MKCMAQSKVKCVIYKTDVLGQRLKTERIYKIKQSYSPFALSI